jgi:hypothetical protein
MGTLRNPGRYDCAPEQDEPMFTLLGRDPNAPSAVRKWARERAKLITQGEKPDSDMAKVREAMDVAAAMETYRLKRQSVLQRQSAIPHYAPIKED